VQEDEERGPRLGGVGDVEPAVAAGAVAVEAEPLVARSGIAGRGSEPEREPPVAL
jgi:hypothetical protein